MSSQAGRTQIAVEPDVKIKLFTLRESYCKRLGIELTLTECFRMFADQMIRQHVDEDVRVAKLTEERDAIGMERDAMDTDLVDANERCDQLKAELAKLRKHAVALVDEQARRGVATKRIKAELAEARESLRDAKNTFRRHGEAMVKEADGIDRELKAADAGGEANTCPTCSEAFVGQEIVCQCDAGGEAGA